MRKSFVAVLFILGLIISTSIIASIVITIQGLPCPFCLNKLKTNLMNIPGVLDAKISDNNQTVSLKTVKNPEPDIALIKKTIIDSGYVPVNINSQPGVKHVDVKNEPCNTCHK